MSRTSTSSEETLVSNATSSCEQDKTSYCKLCQRTQVALTRHHLIPQSRHNKARTKRQFAKSEMTGDIAMLCRPCHSQIHRIFSNQALAEYYHSIERLQAHTEVEKFIQWIKKRPAGSKVRVKSKR